MRLTEYIDYLNNGNKNKKRYTHFTVQSERLIGIKKGAAGSLYQGDTKVSQPKTQTTRRLHTN